MFSTTHPSPLLPYQVDQPAPSLVQHRRNDYWRSQMRKELMRSIVRVDMEVVLQSPARTNWSKLGSSVSLSEADGYERAADAKGRKGLLQEVLQLPSNYAVLGEYLQKARILELKRRYFEDYYSNNQYAVFLHGRYERIRACTHRQRKQVQYVVIQERKEYERANPIADSAAATIGTNEAND
ncbi:hypothetical protein Tco_0553322 [Tanacetum coccineum]